MRFLNSLISPKSDSPLPVSSRVCFVKFHDPDSAVVAQHLTNTVFVDRALIVVPYAEVFHGSIKAAVKKILLTHEN
ncbi:PREDICTED: serine/arginine-rich splicing factor 11-like [Galeopterus variegatus]|uniref:Serine/arginine-rich splicing factor 11-like n=1 Tax=Galeopterus variegatus TaxID=482537 RepID=A0ABM0S6K4_GALVR|nr:PREDICTED: serine/arginine-rich splicing factor 11-like [Galeopterus variegatus]